MQIELQNKKEIEVVFADRKLIEICFDTLLNNAIKYSSYKAQILVNIDSKCNTTYIDFIDQGKGFPDLANRKLFDLFNPGDKHIDKNTGLNLAILKMIMEAHNGRIEISNNSTGGAKVSIQFPEIISE